MFEEDLVRLETIIINQNNSTTNETSCCPIPSREYQLYFNTINEMKSIEVKESSDSYARSICSPYHEMKLHVNNSSTNETILELNKPYKCCCPAAFQCLQKDMTVTRMNGTNRKVIGYIQEPFLGGCCKPRLQMFREKKGRPIGTMNGPCLCIGGSLCSKEFHILSPDLHEISTIDKGGVIEDIEIRRTLLSSPADQYHLTFVDPLLSNDDKLVILASLLLSDYLFFPGESFQSYRGKTVCNCRTCPPKISCKLCGIYCCGVTFPLMCSCCC